MQTSHQMRRCWAEIDLAALERNLGLIRAALPRRIKYIAVVKADAYGHGFHQTVTRLMQAGADMFAVANIEEAKQIEEIGAGWPILVLGPLLPDEIPELLEHDWQITLSSRDEVAALDAIGRERNLPIKAHLKLDTGMGRAGVWHTEALELYNFAKNHAHIELCGVYTHFSSADSDPEFTDLQRKRLEAFIEASKCRPSDGFLIHADNSAGIATLKAKSPFNAVRIGLLQFGIQPYVKSALSHVPVESVFSFHTRVALIKELPAGTPISYGRTYVLEKDARVAILTAGYADGVPFPSSGSGQVLVCGKRCAILGRVTMDQTIIDASKVPELQVGDPAVLIGKQGEETLSLKEFSKHGHTIPWESLTSITKRVQRVYKTALNL